MIATATSPTANSLAQKEAAPWRSYALFTLCASMYLLPFMRIMFTAGDEGTLLCGAERIVHGEVFARDFFEVMGPGTFYWMAAFFKLFGISFLTTRICLFISSLGTGLSMYFLSRRVCTRYQAIPGLILAGTYFGPSWPEISHHVDSIFFGLLAVVCMVLWHSRRQNYLLIAAGVLAGVTTCILQPKGLYLFVAFLAWLLLQRRRTPSLLAAAGLMAGGYLAVAAVVLTYFWSQGAMGSLVYANFVFPSQHYGTANGVSYAQDLFTFYWDPWVTGNVSKWLLGIASIVITPLLFVAALPAFMLILGIRTKWKSVIPEITLYWLCGWAFWLSEFHRKDMYHLISGSALLIILCIHAMTESRSKLAHVALQALAISAVCLAGFNWCFVLAAGTHASATHVGTVAAIGREATLRLLDKHVSSGEEVLIYPYCPTCYFLSATENPTRYSFLLYGYNTREQFNEAVRAVDRQRVKYVIWDTTFGSKAARAFPGLPPVKPQDLILEPYLESHYRLVEDDHGIRLMERKGDNLAK